MAGKPENLFLQNTSLRNLEVFLQEREPGQFHFYSRGISFTDIADVYGGDLKSMQALIFRIPPSVLNANYWEPFSKDAEERVRQKMVGLITREGEGRTEIWRSDQVAESRLLKDGLEVDAKLLLGFVLQVSGEGLLELGRAAEGHGERFEWVGFHRLPGDPLPDRTVMQAHEDLSRMRITLTDVAILHSTQDDSLSRLVFTDRQHFRSAVAALLRGYIFNLAGVRIPNFPDRIADQLLRVSDGLGLNSDSERDFVDKKRTYEIICHIGKTEWAVHLKPGQDAPFDDDKLLIYYDKISGIWAVAT